MQSVSGFSKFETHENFSKQLKDFSDTFLQKNLQDRQEIRKKIKNLVGKWIQRFNSPGAIEAVNVSGTFNTLSKLGIFDKIWQEKDQSNLLKNLIVKLAEKGNEISKKFNSQYIANTLNALSKWDVFGNKWNGDQQELKDLIIKLVDQGIQSSTQFNSQAIANTLNALSKWDVLDEKEWEGSVKVKREDGTEEEVSKVELFKQLIVKLIEQGSEKDFNSQEIANTLNALSKWDVLDKEIEAGSKEKCRALIVKLVDQGIQSSTQFNSQEIANTFDALYKFNILDDKKWAKDKQNKIKLLIVQLAKKGQEQEVLENFNSQEIANILNAFSELNILGDKWTDNEQEELKSLISQLAKRGSGIEGYNLKGIAKIYSALLKWSNDDDEFKSLTYKLEKQVQAIAQKQNEEGNILDNIRFTSQIITDLPNLKSKELITSDKRLLIDLMQCLGSSIDKSKVSDLKGVLPKKNILSGLEDFVNIVDGLEDKFDLVGKFDQSLIIIFKKLSDMALGSEYKNKEIINKLIGLEVIKDKDALQKLLVGQPEKVPERKEENKPGSGATLLVQPFSGKDGSISGSSQLPKKQEREEEEKLTIARRQSTWNCFKWCNNKRSITKSKDARLSYFLLKLFYFSLRKTSRFSYQVDRYASFK
ncbi:MAG: hypothetical protein TV41_05785 [Wolbachia endosymbiont of Dactylopius coccus]|nr:MAG: hypothetical protein TV41_05785 [Wolbachia endosymbiont of Dactylopius coccus]